MNFLNDGNLHAAIYHNLQIPMDINDRINYFTNIFCDQVSKIQEMLSYYIADLISALVILDLFASDPQITKSVMHNLSQSLQPNIINSEEWSKIIDRYIANVNIHFLHSELLQIYERPFNSERIVATQGKILSLFVKSVCE